MTQPVTAPLHNILPFAIHILCNLLDIPYARIYAGAGTLHPKTRDLEAIPYGGSGEHGDPFRLRSIR